MNRAFLLLIPAVLAACSAAKSEDEIVGGDTSDLTEMRDFSAIESSLGLTMDPDRSRPELLVKRGPCYKKLAAGTRAWNFRRYQTGAAFFYEDGKTEEPLSPITCIDIDIDVGAQFPRVVELSGQALDMALRFKLGTLKAFGPPQIQHDGIEIMSFDAGWIAVLPDGRVRDFFPFIALRDRKEAGAPSITDVLSSAATLAHRYAKEARSFRDTDPIGFFKSAEDRFDPASGKFAYVVKFDYARVEYESVAGAEKLTLVNVMEETLAGCERAGDYACWNIHGAEHRWEKDPR